MKSGQWFGLAAIAAVTAGLAILGGQTGSRQEAPRFDSPIQAVHYRSSKRLSEDGKIPDDAMATALRQRSGLVEAGDGAGVFPGGWTWHGPGNIGGRVRAIVFHPGDTNIMWTGGCSGGIWKTTNGGATWQPMDDFMSVMPIGCMAIDKFNPDVLYAGTGEGFFETVEGSSNTAAVRGAGIFRSTDGGANWSQMPSTTGPNWYFVNRIAMHPANSQIMLAATASGIWRTTDAGLTWIRTDPGFAYDVQFHPTDGNRLVAGFHDLGVKVSTDGGVSWTASNGDGNGHRSEVRYAESNPSIVYAAVSAAGRIKAYRSTDGGLNFTLMTSGSGIQTYEAYNSVLWIDPLNPNTIVVGGVYLFRSTNGGATFTQAFNNVHADMHVIVKDPNYNGTTNKRVFFGCDGGIYRANDSATNAVVALNGNLGITQFYGAVRNPANNKIVGGTQDNGTLMFTGNPQAWSSVFGGDGVYCEYDPTDANYWYGGIYYAQIFRSTTGGPNGSYIYNGISDAGSSTTCNFIAYFGLDPNNANTMIVGARNLWRSTNVKAGTPIWTIIKPTIQPRPGPGWIRDSHMVGNPPWNVSTFTVAQWDSDLIWVGYNKGEVWKTTNGTATTPSWTRLDNGATQLPARWVSSIRIDPNNNEHVIVAFMGYEPDNLWETTDGGTTWSEISGNLPSVPISAITTHPYRSRWLYAGTDVGLFTSSDGGATWSTQNVGPGIAPVEELRWTTPQELLAVTHGRGIYTAVIPNSIDEPCSPLSFAVTSGTLTNGRLDHLFASDDRRIEVSAAASAELGHPIAIEFEGEAPPPNIVGMRIFLEASCNRRSAAQRLWCWNYQTSTWDQVDLRMTSSSDQMIEVTVHGAQPYMHPTSRRIKAKLTFERFAGDTAGSFIAKVDQFYWSVVGP